MGSTFVKGILAGVMIVLFRPMISRYVPGV